MLPGRLGWPAASINNLRILIDVEQLTIEHSRISLSAEAMP
jgi:hypothetical protein